MEEIEIEWKCIIVVIILALCLKAAIHNEDE